MTLDGHWETPHPGNGKIIITSKFEEAMESWFEGFNLPRYVNGAGERDDFETAYHRVKKYLRRDRNVGVTP